MTDKQLQQVRLGNLKTICDLGKEMRRVYRKCHQGEIKVEDMSRYINALNVIIGAACEAGLEKRMDLIEKSINDLGHPL